VEVSLNNFIIIVFVSVGLLEVSVGGSETVQWLVIILICDIIFAGSNSVNVFLGLGLPWVISTCYHAVRKTKYIVYSGNLTFSVVVFTTFGLICIFTLIARRLIFKGELGGPATSKHMTGLFLVFLWCLYIVVSTLAAYDVISIAL